MSARIWDSYLTQSDKDHLARSPDKRVGFGSRPALLLVDLYRAVFGDKPEPLLDAIETWPSSCGMAGWNALPHIQRILEASRKARIPIVHITILADSGMLGWFDAAHRASGGRGAGATDEAALDRKRRSPEIIDEVKPLSGEVVLKKTAPSAFWGTPLAGHLTLHGIDTLIVCGEATSGCVRASVVDAASHRYRVQVVEEGVFDRHEATHALNLFDLHQKYADVISVDEAARHLSRLSDRS
ncbi:MAG: Isochorismatase family protein [Hyphomicrobiales bacterium]|nr:Isochorismatase family protein [Hyphomicrobiales bacterium]